MSDRATLTETAEREAVAADARLRLAELRRVRAALWPDRDAPEVWSELTWVCSQVRSAEAALRAAEAHTANRASSAHQPEGELR